MDHRFASYAWSLATAALCGLALAAAGCDSNEQSAEPAAADPPVDMSADVGVLDAGPPVDPCWREPASSAEFPPELAAALSTVLYEESESVEAELPFIWPPYGVVVGVTLGDGRQWFAADGITDFASQTPISTADRFRLGSITKTVVASAVMRHVEAGDWALDDAIEQWVPGFDLGPEVTLDRVLSHTAGVPNYTDNIAFLLRRTERVEPSDVVDFALATPSGIVPGEGFLYSNTGYYLLGMALEALEGRPLAEILADTLARAEVEGIWLEQYASAPNDCSLVQGHVNFDPAITDGFSASWAWAAGGLAAPIAEMCRWGQGLLVDDAVVAPDSLEVMLRVEPLSEPGGLLHGRGLQFRTVAGEQIVGHSGSTMGFATDLFVHRETGHCVAVLTNDFQGVPLDFADLLWAVLLGGG